LIGLVFRAGRGVEALTGYEYYSGLLESIKKRLLDESIAGHEVTAGQLRLRSNFMSKYVPERVLHAKMLAMSRIAGLRRSPSLANQKRQDLASQDGLAGLCNRLNMDMRTYPCWSDAVSDLHEFGLLMLDIDNFKKYNDHYGHQAGDDCLKQVAGAIDASTRDTLVQQLAPSAFAARNGGEEGAEIVP
jgi:PleD family two-component response regulator